MIIITFIMHEIGLHITVQSLGGHVDYDKLKKKRWNMESS